MGRKERIRRKEDGKEVQDEKKRGRMLRKGVGKDEMGWEEGQDEKYIQDKYD